MPRHLTVAGVSGRPGQGDRYNLAGLVEAFWRGQVDFVRIYSKERWGEVLPPRTDLLVLGFQQLNGT